jgi:hypothetical protein
MQPCMYRIPNGPPGPSPARARNGPALSGPTLSGPMDYSCRAVSGVVPNWRPRHGPKACFSGRASTTPKTARWAGARPGTNATKEQQGRSCRSACPQQGLAFVAVKPVRIGRETGSLRSTQCGAAGGGTWEKSGAAVD